MKKLKVSLLLVLFIASVSFTSTAQKEVNKTFDAKEKLKISTVSGDCVIKKSSSDKIVINLMYTYSDDCFKYDFKVGDNYLSIEEDFHGRNCKGESQWTISIPTNISVKFNSASGDLELNNVDNNFYANTASGDITLENINGESKINTASGDVSALNCKDGLRISTASGNIKAHSITDEIVFSTASGNIELDDAKGNFILKSASGDVNAENIDIIGKSKFIAASGNVKVVLANTPAHDMVLSSASGNSVLDYNGNEIKGYFEFSARVKKGDIISPIKFDKEEVIEKNGQEYDLKSFTKGGSSPVIKINTASGSAKLIK